MMKVTGKCHCGKIEFNALIDPEQVMICHCTDCQMMASSPYRVSVKMDVKDFQFIKGSPKVYIKTADSGTRRVQAFCGDCATPLYSEPVEKAEKRALRIGSLNERAKLIPKKQIWCRSALDWAGDLSEIKPKFGKGETA